MKITVLTTSDRQLDALLRSFGAEVTIAGFDALTELADPSARQPGVIVGDARDRSTMPAELALIKRQHPATGILVVLPRLESTLILDAMRAGANECVADPITREDLEAGRGRMAG